MHGPGGGARYRPVQNTTFTCNAAEKIGKFSLLLFDRLSNHPDFVGNLPILLENTESRPICDRDRKKSRFSHLF